MGITGNLAKFYRTDLVICSHSREGKKRLIAKSILISQFVTADYSF